MIRLWKTTLKLRMLIGFMVIIIFGALLAGRAFELQIVRGPELRKLAREQFHAKVYFTPKRGNIYAADGSMLAASIDVPGIAVDPIMVREKLKAAEELSKITGLGFETVIKVLNRKVQFAWIKRRVPEKTAANIEKLGISGIVIVKQPVRYYPNGSLLAHVLGFVGIDDNGLSGLEYKYNKRLKGNKRALRVLHDGLGQYIFIKGFGLRKATHGDNIYLTINKQLQFVTQYYLDKEAEKFNSKGAFAILIDPNTGAVLAMADYPGFNPNRYWTYSAKYWRNRAVTDDFEPGSIMKPFVVAAALSQGLVRPSTTINCYHGSYPIEDIVVHDVENWFGKMSVNQIVEYSSNVGECQIGMMFNKMNLYDWFLRWGFGKRPGGDILGEASGIIKPPSQWSGVGPCEMAFGQGISATGLQIADALSAVANGGFMVKPYIVNKIVDPYGKVIFKAKPKLLGRVISREVDMQVKHMMRLVVTGGTGQYAGLIDFKVSGKTGTGQVADPKTGKYYNKKFTGSFMAFVPYRHPKLAMIVVQQEPSYKTGYYGGQVSAPVVRGVFENAMNILNIYPGKDAYAKQSISSKGTAAGISTMEGLQGAEPHGMVYDIMPNLAGMTMMEALKALSPYKLNISLSGSGYLYYQSISAGSSLDGAKNLQILLKFASGNSSAPVSGAENANINTGSTGDNNGNGTAAGASGSAGKGNKTGAGKKSKTEEKNTGSKKS